MHTQSYKRKNHQNPPNLKIFYGVWDFPNNHTVTISHSELALRTTNKFLILTPGLVPQCPLPTHPLSTHTHTHTHTHTFHRFCDPEKLSMFFPILFYPNRVFITSFPYYAYPKILIFSPLLSYIFRRKKSKFRKIYQHFRR